MTYRVQPALRNISWRIEPGQQWAIVGPNSAGKTSIANIITGTAKHFVGRLTQSQQVRDRGLAYVCFEQQKGLIERDQKLDDSEFRPDAKDPGTTVRDTLFTSNSSASNVNFWIDQLDIRHILDRGIRFISTGEARKTLLIQAICSNPQVLLLDSPTDGLDRKSQLTLISALDVLLQGDPSIVLILRDLGQVPDRVSHLLVLDRGRIVFQGTKAEALATDAVRAVFQPSPLTFHALPRPPARDSVLSKDPIVFRNVSVCFDDNPVLSDVCWHMSAGQNTLLAGPNGSGKTTLLSLVTGDSPKAYGQDITIFGTRRGSGESVWDIKQHFGLLDTSTHLKFPQHQTVLEAVLSGFYDSQGLYQTTGASQRQIAAQWLATIGLADLINAQFGTLSFGQQRLILLARALVKHPRVLILDEPTLGLDAQSTQCLLNCVDHVIATSDIQLIFVSHSIGERPRCINQYLEFQANGNRYQLVCTND